VHAAGALVVDLNDMNFLVDDTLSTVFAIDVDSYQTASHPATAVSPATRDPHTLVRGHFTKLSDWFAFAILAFQLWTGVHPYRGKHPHVKSLEQRMQQQLSVMNPHVKVPKVARPIAAIPAAYRSWLHAVLEEGKRLPPPTQARISTPAIAPAAVPLASSADLSIVRVLQVPSRIRDVVTSQNGELFVLTDDAVYAGKRRLMQRQDDAHALLAITPRGRPVLCATRRAAHHPAQPSALARARQHRTDGLSLIDVSNHRPLASPSNATQLVRCGQRVVGKADDKIVELLLRDAGSAVIASAKTVATVLPHASKLFAGVVVQSLLGACYLSLFSQDGCHQVRVPELDERTVLAAAHQRGVVVVTVRGANGFDRALLRLERHGSQLRDGYQLSWTRGLSSLTADLVVLANGVAILRSDTQLQIFDARPGHTTTRSIDNDLLARGGWLLESHGRVLWVIDDEVHQLQTHKPAASVHAHPRHATQRLDP